MKPADVTSLRILRLARDRVDRDHAEPVGIAALATGAGYSREHFIRAFRAAYGETPGRYRTRRRVERACELLRSANLTVTEICYAGRLGQLVQLHPADGLSPAPFGEDARPASRAGGTTDRSA